MASIIVELRTVFPQPGMPYSQRNDPGAFFQLLATRLSVNQVPVSAKRSFSALL